jgi:hypothetical protein
LKWRLERFLALFVEVNGMLPLVVLC